MAGGAYKTFSSNLNAQECVNWIPVNDPEGKALRGTPGLKPWKNTGKDAEVRGVKKFGLYLYAVVGNTVYRVSEAGAISTCTGTLDTSSGVLSETQAQVNPTQLMIVDGVSGYIVTGTTVTKITDEDFPPNPFSVAQHDNRFVVSVRGSGIGYISDSNNGLSWDSTITFSAESRPDDLLSVISDHDDLLSMGAESYKAWYTSSDQDNPLLEKPGTIQEKGIGARKSVVKHDNAVFFLTNDFQVVRLQGYQPVPVSTRSIEYQIAQYAVIDDAFGMSINIEGNAFYVLTFVSEGVTWCYNAATKEWNQLMSFPVPYDHRWRGNCYAKFAGKHIIGDYKNGMLYELDFDTFTDNGELIRRVRTIPTIKKEGKNIFVSKLEIFFEAGKGLATGQGSDPMAMLQVSRDGGHTWGNEIWRPAGPIGKYRRRSCWNKLGRARQFNPRLVVTDPIKWVVTGANMEAKIGTS